jgi:hypothetical protein
VPPHGVLRHDGTMISFDVTPYLQTMSRLDLHDLFHNAVDPLRLPIWIRSSAFGRCSAIDIAPWSLDVSWYGSVMLASDFVVNLVVSLVESCPRKVSVAQAEF